MYFTDITPPQIDCPADVVVNSDPGLYYATLDLNMPKGKDNSGIPPSMSSIPVLTSKMKFKIGSTSVSVQATDVTGNVGKCTFSITVKGDLDD